MGFRQVRSFVFAPRGPGAPRSRQFIGYPRDWLGIGIPGAEIPGLRKSAGILAEPLGQQQVAAKRSERTARDDRRKAPNEATLAGEKRPHQVGNQLIARPVAPTDGVASPCARSATACAPCPRRKKESRYAEVTSSAQPFEFE